MNLTWIGVAERVEYELRQCEEEGLNVNQLRAEWREIGSLALSNNELQQRANEFYLKLERTFPPGAEFPDEPSSWAGISSVLPVRGEEHQLASLSKLGDRIQGGWLGRSAGCLLGKPVEKIPRSGIIALLSSNGTWPIRDYISALGISEAVLRQYPWNKHAGKESLKENIVCMNEDDDMNYAMLNLSVFERYGTDFTTDDIAHAWLTMLPVLSTFSAERVAYANLIAGTDVYRAALVRNPYREWIGAQIRADAWGWVSPGQPGRAAMLAFRDAQLSHVRNGIYAEMFFAAAIALASVLDSTEAIIRGAVEYIPPRSRLSDAIHFILSLPVQDRHWDETVDLIYQKFGQYHWVHSINNASLVVAALLSSKGDFERAICNVVMGGWDTDSNGATVGSIMGTMIGAEKIPRKWTGPLNNRIRSSLQGFDNVAISDLAERTTRTSIGGSFKTTTQK